MEKALSQGVQTERNLHLQQQSFTQQQRQAATQRYSRPAAPRAGGAIELYVSLGPCLFVI